MFENIPKNWKKDKLENISSVNYGTRIVKESSTGNEYYVYGGGDKTFKTDTYNRENTLIVARFGMSPKCTRFVKGKFFLNDSGLTVDTNNNNLLNQDFLNWQLFFLNDLIYSLGKGVAQKNLNVTLFKKINIAIPPTLEEQQEIVDVLDAASEIIRLRTACIESAQSLIPALFQEMFGDMHDKNENLVAIGSVIEETSQVNPQKLFTDQFLYIDISSINNETGIIESPKIINIDNIPSRARKLVKVDDLLVAMTRPYLKGFAMVPENLDNNIASTGFSVLRAQKDKIVPKYLYAYIRSDYFINQIIPKMRGANYPAVTDNDVKSVKIPLPKLDQQELFAAKVQEIEAYIKIQQAELEKAQTMFNSLLHHAFTGKLTENITFEVENE